MKIITLETLKTMPNGTVFCPVGEGGVLSKKLQIITGKFKACKGFNMVMGVCPIGAENEFDGTISVFDEFDEKRGKDIPTCIRSVYVAPKKTYENYKLFAVFSKAEVGKMIKTLQWALSDLKDDFDMDEVIKE